MEIDLSTGTPPSPERTLLLAQAFAELVRTLNHQTMDHAAFGTPDDADRVLREIETAASRIPQLLSQVGRWFAAEDEARRLAVPSGEWQDAPHAAVTALQDRLGTARGDAEALSADLKRAAQVTGALAEQEDDGGE